MKKHLCILVSLLLGAGGTLNLCAQVRYQVNGSWASGDGEKVYLNDVAADGNSVAADSVVVKDGMFVFKGMTDNMKRMEIKCLNASEKLFIDEVPINVVVTEQVDTVKGAVKRRAQLEVSGSREQGILKNANNYVFTSSFLQLGQMLSYSKAMQSGKDSIAMRLEMDSIQNVFKIMNENLDKNITAFLDSTRNSYAVTYFIDEYIGKQKPFDLFKQSYDNLTDQVKQSVLGIALKEKVDAMSNVNVGGIAPNIELPTPDGGTLSLYSLRGHIVLLDFWASWCGPCLREAPNVKKIYEKYHEKGLEVLGVSLDEKEDAWKNAIAKHGLNWKHVSSLKGWECPSAKLYNVTGIPRMYIIDQEGRIIAQDLRGEELAQKIASLFE